MNMDELAEQCVKALAEIPTGDKEIAHEQADDALLSFLRASGFGEVADAWEGVCERAGGFWYA